MAFHQGYILVVEDSATQAMSLQHALEQDGYTVQIAENGKAGLAAVERDPPRLILTDIVMPEMDGYELCEAVKGNEATSHIPVILLTALSHPSDVIRGLKCGADNFLTKPVQQETLSSRVRHIMLNAELRKNQQAQLSVEVYFDGKKHQLNAERIQIIDMLLATYETAVQQNKSIQAANESLQEPLNRVKALEAQYRSALDNSADGNIVVNNQGIVLYTNPAAQEMFGHQHGELKGQPFPIILHPERVDEIKFETPDGEERFAEVRTVKTAWEDRSALLATFRDITQRIRAQQEAEASERSKGIFLANMSHEIRTPMNGVIGIADLLRRTTLDREQARYVNSIIESGEVLLDIINDILDFSKIEANQLTLEEKPIDLEFLMESLVGLFTKQCQDKGVELILSFGADTPRTVIGDPVRIKQIATNLMSNAVKFTSEGHVKVSVDSTPSGVDGHADIAISVEDTGIGIRAEKINAIFESFSQADDSITRRFGGTGLGLAISRQLSRQMGGDIHVTSEQGKGSVFTATLQLQVAEDGYQIPDYSWRSSRILLIDHNSVRSEAVGQMLSNWGVRFDIQTGYERGIAEIESANRAGDPYWLAIIHSCIDTSARKPGDIEKLDTWFVKALSMHPEESTNNCESAWYVDTCSSPFTPSALQELLTDLWDRRHGNEVVPRIRKSAETHSRKMQVRFDDSRILLVEDNALNQQVAVSILKELGCVVDVANDGVEALERLAEKSDYDLIFMDVHMPRMDGFETTARIRANPELKQALIVAMTARAIKGDRERCLAAGMDDYISKPIRIADCGEMLGRHLQPSEIIEEEAHASKQQPSPKPASSSQAIQKSDKLIDMQAALDINDGNIETLKMLLPVALEDLPEQAHILEKAVSENDLSTIQRQFHTIKSQSTYFGATALINLTSQAEKLADSGDLQGAKAMAPDALQLVNQLLKELQSVDWNALA